MDQPSSEKQMKFSTRAIHSIYQEIRNVPLCSPLYMSASFVLEDEKFDDNDFVYSRGGNPTRNDLEEILKNLEECRHCSVFSSGLAAIAAVLELLAPNDHIVSSAPLYGGTYRLFTRILSGRGIGATFPTHACETISSLITQETKLVFLEIPSNPLMTFPDIHEVKQLCANNGALLVVDNTFNTPYNFQPLLHGADIVIYSTTKYLNGHGDILGGAVLTNSDSIAQKIGLYQKGIGAVPSVFDCWLQIRSLSTLALRMQQHNSNGMRIASFLETLPEVERVIYPGLISYQDHDRFKKYFSQPGAMMSFFLKSEFSPATFISNLSIIKNAVSYGCVKTQVTVPWMTTHKEIPDETKKNLGLTPLLIRLSAGIEDADDLIADIKAALEKSA